MAINTEYQGGTGAFDHAKKAVDEARAFKEAVSSRAQSFSESVDLRGRVQRNPLAMVAAAAGLGYVLGGGLFSPMTGRILRYGIRIAILPFLKNQLEAMAGGVQASERTSGVP
jgi:hypothetical protein